MAKVVVVGIDGASFNFLKPMIDKGEMPNIKRLMDTGCYGSLKSLLPSLSVPAWKSYSTGKNYGKLGAFGWINVDCKNKRMYVNVSSRIKSREFWDYLGDEGKKSGLINMPLTYPVRKLNGFLIAGGVQSVEADYTYPSELKKELAEKFGYRISKTFLPMEIETPELEEETLDVIKSKFDVAKAKLKDVDFLQVVIYRTDSLLHFHWGTEFLKKGFRLIDEQIGLLWKAAGEDCDFIVMSDHGFRKLEWVFYSNNWLRQKGYLVEKKGMGELFNKAGISRDAAVSIAKRLHILPLLKGVPKAVSKTIKSGHGEIGGTDAMYLIDWDKTKVIGQSPGTFYINRDGRERDEIAEKLRKELLEVRHPETGERIIEKVFTRDEIYSGNKMDLAPDLVAVAGSGVEIEGSFGLSEVFSNTHHWKGVHDWDGLFIFNGKSFAECTEMQKAGLLDLMPTILHLLECSVPEDIDGTVLGQFIRKESSAGKRAVKKRAPLPDWSEEQEKIEDRARMEQETEEELRKMGYVK